MFTPSFLNTYTTADFESELLFPKLEKEIPLEHICDFLENYLLVDDFFNYRRTLNRTLISKIASDFENEYTTKQQHFKDLDLITLQSIFIHSILSILKKSPDFIGLELTRSQSLFIVAKFEAVTSHFEFFFRGNDNKIPEALTVINIYTEKEHILADSGSFRAAIACLEEILPASPTFFFNRFPLVYGVSRSNSTEFTI